MLCGTDLFMSFEAQDTFGKNTSGRRLQSESIFSDRTGSRQPLFSFLMRLFYTYFSLVNISFPYFCSARAESHRTYTDTHVRDSYREVVHVKTTRIQKDKYVK